MTSHTVEILHFDGCPHARGAVDLARAVVAEAGARADVREVRVGTEADARAAKNEQFQTASVEEE